MSGGSYQADFSLMLRRMGSALVDLTIELAGGVLGSYFGVMVAALIVAMKDKSADELQHSMFNGMGFGFAFWMLAISFLNRVLIQGVSRASLGKKLFKLELISSTEQLTWTIVMNRWLMSYVSLVMGGLGYAYLFFNKDARAFHDAVMDTDVVPAYAGYSMSIEYRETMKTQIPLSLHGMSPLTIIAQQNAERPMAQIIRLPVKPEVAAAVAESEKIAEVVELHPKKDSDKKAA